MFRNHRKPASNCSSSSCSNRIHDEEEDLLTFELRCRKASPMKKLLAKEMRHESKSRSSPGVVAKLMGLDSLPPPRQHPLGRQRPKPEPAAPPFKDVYEVPANDMDFIRRKFREPRHRCCHVSAEPTRIVVLKPNVGRDRKDTEVPLARKREVKTERSASRQLAKQITRQMRLAASSKGYAADDSSCCSESPPELFGSSPESLMSREGKRRLSDRWKLNHHHHHHLHHHHSRGSTLAEMLAVSEEKEARRAGREQPFGISSRDGWKDSAAKLTRSKSLPTSSKAGEDRYVSSLRERKKSRSRSNSATSFPCPYVITQRQSDDTCSKKTQSFSGNVTDTSSLDKTPTPRSTTIDNESSPTPLQEPPSKDREESPVPMDRSVPSSESKDGDQPSPVSVLAAPFSNDPTSSPDCFESLSADLQGLRMQLQLLKLESESYEGHTVLSSDEDKEERSSSMMCNSQMSWETRYAIDALVYSTLDDDDPDSFVASWHSRDSPIGLHVFEALQDYEHRPKCERKLLFDRINEAIMDMNERSLLGPNELQERLIRFVSGSEEAKKEMAERVQSQWLDLRKDLEAVAATIQKSLYDDLVAELLDFSY